MSGPFWKDVTLLLRDIFKASIHLLKFCVMMGQQIFDPKPLINYIILLGKQCIYKYKVIGSKPNIYLFKGRIDFLFQVENHIALEEKYADMMTICIYHILFRMKIALI